MATSASQASGEDTAPVQAAAPAAAEPTGQAEPAAAAARPRRGIEAIAKLERGEVVPKRGSIPRWETDTAAFCERAELQSSASVSGRGRGETRVYAMSALHADRDDNREFLNELVERRRREQPDNKDVLIVAGDVSEDPELLLDTVQMLRTAFGAGVVFVPGNHDLWRGRKDDARFKDSAKKLHYLLRECEARGVSTSALHVEAAELWVVPLHSWHHQSWDREPSIAGIKLPPLELCMSDYHNCQWPTAAMNDPKSDAVALYMDELNDAIVERVHEGRREGETCITCSHFLPHQELMPTKRMLFLPELPKACGSDLLRPRIDEIGDVSAHVFGHTHFCWDQKVDDVRFLSCPLAYPNERKMNMNGGGDWVPLAIWDSAPAVERWCPEQPAFWSTWYKTNGRDPSNMELAPWVEKRWGKRRVEVAAN